MGSISLSGRSVQSINRTPQSLCLPCLVEGLPVSAATVVSVSSLHRGVPPVEVRTDGIGAWSPLGERQVPTTWAGVLLQVGHVTKSKAGSGVVAEHHSSGNRFTATSESSWTQPEVLIHVLNMSVGRGRGHGVPNTGD